MEERSDCYEGMHISKGVENFQSCLTSIGLTDLHSQGGVFFAWSNKRSEDFIPIKLDSILVNDLWLQNFLEFLSEFTASDFSHHNAGWLRCMHMNRHNSGPFRYFSFLLKK